MTQALLPLFYRLARIYWWFRQPLSLGARVALLHEEQVYLVKLTYVRGWHLPGGGIKKGESLEECARRECREEAGIEPEELEFFHIYYNRNEYKHDHVAVYLSRKFRRLKERQDALEIVEGRFFPLNDLPEETTPATVRRLDEIRSGKIPDRTW